MMLTPVTPVLLLTVVLLVTAGQQQPQTEPALSTTAPALSNIGPVLSNSGTSKQALFSKVTKEPALSTKGPSKSAPSDEKTSKSAPSSSRISKPALSSSRISKPALSNKFVGVRSRCSRGSLTVDVTTAESFYGAVYARGYPSSCRVVGRGATNTSLLVPAQQCGVRVIDDQLGHQTYELLVYIQFDQWVQQVIDEQVLIRCRLHSQSKQMQAAAQMSVGNQEVEAADGEQQQQHEGNSLAVVVLAPDPATSQLVSRSRKIHPERSRGQEDPLEDWQPFSLPPELLLWRSQRPEGNSEPVSCWMDIVAGTSMDGEVVVGQLLVGEEATMVVRVRHGPGLDTRITSCLAHDGSGDQSHLLIDQHGCAVDDDIMPPLRVKSNHRTGVKVAYASFKAFKFPDRDNLHLRCTVLVCLGSCHLAVCGRTSNRVGRRMAGQGSIQPQPPPLQAGQDQERSLATTLLDRVQVFNSVEVRAPGIESRPDLVKQYRVDRNEIDSVDFFSEENLLCVTPYKMVLAFGVLLTVLLVALLFGLYSCVKARVMRARLRPPHPGQAHPHSPVATPYYRFPH